MGSFTIDNTSTMAEDKKNPLKSIFKNIKCKLGIKKEKEPDTKETKKEIKAKQILEEKPKKQEIVEDILANFRKLEIENKKLSEQNKIKDESKKIACSKKENVENEQDNFTCKKVSEENRNRTESIESQTSHDSGFSEKGAEDKSDDVSKDDDEVIKTEDSKSIKNLSSKKDDKLTEKDQEDELTKKEQEVLESLQSLKIENGKKKKSQVVPVKRGPVRHRVGDMSGAHHHPYGIDTQVNHTVNKHTFSGGQVIVANRNQDFVQVQDQFRSNATIDELQTFSEDLASIGVNLNGPAFDLADVQEYLDEHEEEVDILREFLEDPTCNEHLNTITTLVGQIEQIEQQQNPIEEFSNTNHVNYEKIENLDSLLGFQEDQLYSNIYPTPPGAEAVPSPPNHEFYSNFLTPPRSETIPSPMSDSNCVLSPNSDCEKYQEISYYEEFPSIPEEVANLPEENTDKKARERNTSTSSLSMKNFKDMQKDLAASFSKKECCQINRKPCRDLFQAHLKKLKVEDRRNMCLQISSMDLKTIFGVLHNVILGLSRGNVDEDQHMALFALLCDKALGTKPQLFVEDFGLSLLKAASLRCPQRPLLVRYVVQCVRAAVRHNPALVEGKDYLFKEVDERGDTLVLACARLGDVHSDALSELVRTEHDQRALFNVQHVNTEGYSALHVACREHGATTRQLHTVHVLLEHGGADIWKGDVKGGDSAVHLAVNSARCELPLVLLLFKHLDRKEWKRLAHQHNRSSVTPLDYARCANKSTTRAKYPPEVVEFLKKCR